MLWTSCRVSTQIIDKDPHLSWTLQKSGEIGEKCASLRWSSCDAGRSAAAGSAPGLVLNQWRSQSSGISRCEWSLSFHWSLRRRVQTPARAPLCLFPRPPTHSDETPLSFPFLWGRPRPIDHDTGDGKRRINVIFHAQVNWESATFADKCFSHIICPLKV